MDLEIKKLAEHFDRYHGEMKGLVEDVSTKLREHGAMITEIEQKMARRPGPANGGQSESLGAQFVASDGFKALAGSQAQRGRAEMQTKATITTATTNAAGSAGAATIPAYRDEISPLPRQRLMVRDLLPVINVTTGAVEVPRLKVSTNNAAMVAEGTLKPQSDLQFDMATINVRVIAHWVKASRQVLDDAPQLQGIIDGELLQGLGLREEVQLLLGDGTGQNLQGLIPQATAYSAPFVLEGATMIDQMGLALLQNANALYPATGIVLNPTDWLRMRLLKDGDGNYVLGPPQQSAPPNLWGVPVVTTPAMPADKFLTGDFQAAATIYDRWSARVEVATENEDDFVKNMLTVLAEERIGLAVKRPLALTYGDFGNAP